LLYVSKDAGNGYRAEGEQEGQRRIQRDINALKERYNRITTEAGLKKQWDRTQVEGYKDVKISTSKKYEIPKSRLTNGNTNDTIAYAKLPKIMKLEKHEYTKQTANVEFGTVQSVVPVGTEVRNVIVMAGKGTSTRIKDIKRLTSEYAELGSSEEWQKKSGTATTNAYTYELHWYECNGSVPAGEIKVKRVKKK